MRRLKEQDDFGSGKYASYSHSSGDKFWGNVAAGCIMYAKSTNRFLINYRSEYVNEPHTYGTIGGKIDEDENPEEAVLREVTEESGYEGDVNLIPLLVFENQNKTFKYYNFLAIIEDEFEPILDWESDGFEWITFDELLNIEPKHPGFKSLLKDPNSYNKLKKISNKEMENLSENSIKRIVSKVINEMDGRYMFFSNLEQIKRQAELLMELPKDQVQQILENGHDWAQDHIATAKESFDQVFDFMMNEFNDASDDNMMVEGRKKAGTKLCARGKSAAKSKFKIYPSAYANGYAVQVCQGKKPGLDGKKKCSPPYC